MATDRPAKNHAGLILRALEEQYRPGHPGSRFDLVKVLRWGYYVRVIDPGVAGTSITSRSEPVWTALRSVPDETVGRIVMLFILAPDELDESSANEEFEELQAREQARSAQAAVKAGEAARRAPKARPARLGDAG